MKAMVLTDVGRLELREAPEPEGAPGDVLLTIAHVGICGSDMHAFLGHDDRRPPPLILGHEAAGVAADGRRYTVNPLVTCGACAYCREGRDNLCPDRQIISMRPRPGAFAERLAMPPENLVEIPAGVPTEKAALAEPLACGWHAVRLASEAAKRPMADMVALSIGGGAIGLGAALALRAFGAAEVWLAETNPLRRELLSGVEGVRVFNPSAEATPAADVIIDGVGYEATRAAASATATPGGVIAHIGLGADLGGLDIRRMTLQEISFIGTFTYTKADFRATAAAIFDGSLGALDWPEIRSLDDGPAAFADIRAGRVAAPKIILAP